MSYTYIVTLLYLSPTITFGYVISIALLSVLEALACASLIQTFRNDPGYLTPEILEQMKLGLGYVKTSDDHSESVLDLSMELTEGTISKPSGS